MPRLRHLGPAAASARRRLSDCAVLGLCAAAGCLPAEDLVDGTVIDDTRTENQDTVGTDGAALIGETGRVTTSGQPGVTVDEDGWTLTNRGRIEALGQTGLHLDLGQLETATAINEGTIVADSGGGAGAVFAGATLSAIESGSRLVNRGTIEGIGGHGLDLTIGTVENAGLIVGDQNGIWQSTAGAFLGRIENTGAIRGRTGTGVLRDAGDDVLINSGLITGGNGTAVAMGGGNDLVELRSGSVLVGDLDGGGGTDLLRLVGTGSLDVTTLGFEELEKNGAGAWVVDVDLAPSVAVTVAGGILEVAAGRTLTTADLTLSGGVLAMQGSLVLTNPMDIGPAGVLAGVGSVFGDIVNAGRLAPGNSIGTLTIVGDYTHSGGTYEVELAPDGRSDLLDVTGTATISGGRILILPQGGYYRAGTTYTVLRASGGLTGAFAGLDGGWVSPVLYWQQRTTPTEVRLHLRRRPYASATLPTHRSLAASLDLVRSLAVGELAGALLVLDNAPTPELYEEGLERLGPTEQDGLIAVGLHLSLTQAAAIDRRLRDRRELPRTARRAGWQGWAEATGSLTSVAAGADRRGHTYAVYGGNAGMDRWLTEALGFGFSAAWLHGELTSLHAATRSSLDDLRGAAYLDLGFGDWYLEGAAGLAVSALERRRPIDFGPIVRVARAGSEAYEGFGMLGLGYRWAPGPWRLEAGVDSHYGLRRENGYTEQGAGDLALRVADRDAETASTQGHCHLSRYLTTRGVTWRPALDLAWRHHWEDEPREIDAAFAAYPGSDFTATGPEPATDRWLAEGRVHLELLPDLQLETGYGVAGSDGDLQTHAIDLELRADF